jgi:glycosyltransferase involved in cell wall biosynthesis
MKTNISNQCCDRHLDRDFGSFSCPVCGQKCCVLHAPIWTDDKFRCFKCFAPLQVDIKPSPIVHLYGELPRKTKSVLLVIDGLYIAGVQQHCIDVIKVLNANNYGVTILSLEGGGMWADSFLSEITDLLIASNSEIGWANIIEYIEHDFQFISTHLFSPIKWSVDNVPYNIPIFAHIHSEPSEHETCSKALMAKIIERCQKIIFPSETTKLLYQNMFSQLGLATYDESKLFVLNNGMYCRFDDKELEELKFGNRNDADVAKSTTHCILCSNKCKYDTIRIAIISRIDNDKISIELIINTVKYLLNHNVNVCVFIAGDGECMPLLKTALSDASIENCVKLLGFVTAIEEIYNWCHVVFLPSKREGMPYVMVEALHFKRPIIAPRVGVFKELMDTECIYIFESEDSVAASNEIIKAYNNGLTKVYDYKTPFVSESMNWEISLLIGYGLDL